MIRLYTDPDDNGVPTNTVDYDEREAAEVPGTLALRFDSELMSLKVRGVDFCGLKRWTEAMFRVVRFNSQAYEEMQRILGPDSDVPPDERATAIEEWVHCHPDYFLTQRVGIWAAVNMGGGHMTLLDVLELSDSDYDDIPEMPPFIAGDGSDDPSDEVSGAGKA